MKQALLLIITLFLSGFILSQEAVVVNDLGVWTGIGIEKSIAKDFELSLEQKLRLNTNATNFDDYIVDLGGKYKINRNFSLAANARYTFDQKSWKEHDNEYRYNFDITYKARFFNKFSATYRIRYQHEYDNLFSKYQNNKDNTIDIRNRLKLVYSLNKNNDLYLSSEVFRTLETYRSPYYSSFRFYLGDKYKTKFGDLNYALGYEQEVNVNDPLTFFFLKVEYKFKF